MAQTSVDPAFAEQHAGLDFCLVTGPVGPRRDDGHLVTGGHLMIGGIEVGLVAMGLFHPRAQVVADDDGRHALWD